MGLGWVMQEAGLQGDQAVGPQLDLLRDGVRLPVPKREGVPVVTWHFCGVEPLQKEGKVCLR